MYYINFNNVVRIAYILYNILKLSSLFYPQNNPVGSDRRSMIMLIFPVKKLRCGVVTKHSDWTSDLCHSTTFLRPSSTLEISFLNIYGSKDANKKILNSYFKEEYSWQKPEIDKMKNINCYQSQHYPDYFWVSGFSFIFQDTRHLLDMELKLIRDHRFPSGSHYKSLVLAEVVLITGYVTQYKPIKLKKKWALAV